MSTGTARLLGHIRRLASPPVRDAETDASLLHRFIEARDEAAFAALVARHAALVLGVCRRVLRDADAAQDAAQATWLVLARKAATVRPPASLATWLHGVARQVARNALREAARRRRRETRSAMWAAAAPPPDPLDELTARELLAVVDEEVQRLPWAYRLAVVLCYLEGKTQEEAARQLGWTLGSVRGRLERGRARLHERLARRGLAPSAPLLAAGLTHQAASVALPPGFAAATAEAAVAWAVRSPGTLAGGAAGRVVALADAVVRGMAASHVKLIAGVLFAVSLAVMAAGLLARPVVSNARPDEKGAPPARPFAAAGEPALGAKSASATDLYGDPLPPGALVRLGTVRLRHGGNAAVAFSGNGKALVSANAAYARFWDPATGALLRQVSFPLPPPPDAVAARSHGRFALSPDGEILAGWDGQRVHVWDVGTGKERARFRVPLQEFGPRADVTELALSADGKTVALAVDGDRHVATVAVRDVATGKERWRHALQAGCGALVFSPDHKWLAADDSSRFLRVWEVRTGNEVHTIKTHVWRLVFSPDAKLLLSAGPLDPVLWDVASGQERATLPKPNNSAMYVALFSPDGRTLAIGDGREILLYDVPTRKLRRRLPHGFTDHLAFTPDGKLLASAGDGGIRLWELATGKLMRPRPAHERNVHTVIASPDRTFVASLADGDGRVYLWDTGTGRPRHILGDRERWAYASAFSADGKWLIGGKHDTSFIWDTATGKEIRRFTVPDPGLGLNKPDIRALALSHDGRRLAVVSEAGDLRPEWRIHIWDTASGKLLLHRLCPGTYSYRFSPAGDAVAFTGAEGLTLLRVMTGHEQVVGSRNVREPLTFSADGRFLAAAKFAGPLWSDPQQGVVVLELATGKPVLKIDCGDVGQLAFAPDGRRLATADAKAIRLWDLATGKEVFRRAAPIVLPRLTTEKYGQRLAFLADGKRVARAMWDSTVLIWDVSPAAQHTTPAARPLDDDELRRSWSDLAGVDAARAYQGAWALTLAPAQAIPFLRRRLGPAAEPDAPRLRGLIADLDDRRFAVREAAAKALAELGPLAAPALRAALAKAPPPEMRRRMEALLAAPPHPPSASELRARRAVAVLERIGSAEARRVLATIADGASEAPLTRDARAALERLAPPPGRER